MAKLRWRRQWRKPSASYHSDGCVQVEVATAWYGRLVQVGHWSGCGLIHVRDSHRKRRVISIPREPDWRFFIEDTVASPQASSSRSDPVKPVRF